MKKPTKSLPKPAPAKGGLKSMKGEGDKNKKVSGKKETKGGR